MRALVYDAACGPLDVRVVPDPRCPPDGVVVDVCATGVCRSDWHAWQGHDPVALPHVGGHELAGVISEVGPEVRRWGVGARVTVPFVCGCGACEYCRAGDPQVCPAQTQPGFTGWGSFAQRVALHAADFNLVGLPDALDFAPAAALGCRFATAYRAVTAHGRAAPGQWMAVYGCGGAGLSAVQIGAALGIRTIAVDVAPAALRLAEEFGAELVVDAGAVDAPAAIAEHTRGGAHVAVDCAGTATTAVQSVLSLRRRGRHVQVGLLLGAHAAPSLPMDRVIGWELSVHGSHGMAAADYPALLALVAAGRVAPERLIGRRTDLAGGGAELAAMGTPAASSGITLVTP